MCGICGIFTTRSSIRDHLDLMPEMIHKMKRRGPDDEGAWTDGRNVAFGFRRLAIIDPGPSGSQPMLSPEERSCLVFNGELYNYRGLRATLETAGRRFRTASDTEVVLQALETWGVDALRKFNGMFALAWFDSATRSLLLARDPMGIKPLYFLRHPDGIVFASQYDQIASHPWASPQRVDPEVLRLYLQLSYVPAPYGILADTYQLEPGHYLHVRPEWDPATAALPFYELPRPTADVHDPEPLPSSLMYDVVNRQMISDVPIGTFLSGGIDSPLVTAYAQEVSDGRVSAFSIATTDAELDEGPTATAFAHALDVDHHLRICGPQQTLGLIDDVTRAYSEPFADYSAFPTLLVSELAATRVKVALSGDGGDELFWGYPRFRKVLAARKLFYLPRPLRHALRAARHRKAYPPSGIRERSIGDWYLDAHSGIDTRQLVALWPDAPAAPADFALYDLPQVLSERELAFWMRRNELAGHLQMVLLKVDRASMYHSLEVRVPLLDLEVVEHAFTLDPSACMSSTAGKLPLRASLGEFIPESLHNSEKLGFSIPMERWLRVELRPLVHDLLLSRDPFPNGLFDRAALGRYYEGFLAHGGRARGLWSLVALQLWAAEHLEA